ncbi:MAG: TetR/AcrR family transcriptional regulator [Rhizobiales bacterium]|nr:TetR/AcrR family transcriptional regulator [Hyphomicrobiales bacterium]
MSPSSVRTRLLDAATHLVRAQGYAATSVDELCAHAGVTKGAFFHHFKSKEDLAVAAAKHWAEWTSALFEQAPYHQPADPLERLLAYVDFRIMILDGRSLPEFTCLMGTMVQETFATNPAIRDACEASISGHAATLVKDIAEAKAKYAPYAEWSPGSLALHTQAVIQGGFILAKAKNDAIAAAEGMRHLRRYIELLFKCEEKE